MSTRTAPAAAPPDRIVPGVLLMVAFTVTIPISDAFAKLAGATVPVAQILAVRFAFQAAVLIPLARRLGALPAPSPRDLAHHAARGALVVAATAALVAAVVAMPLADAIAIFFVEPFVLTLLGAVLLGEHVGLRRLLACATGFAGALLVIRPSFAAVGPVALLPVVAAVALAFYMILTRGIARRLHPVGLQAFTAIAAAAILLPALAIGTALDFDPWTPVRPSPRAAIYLLGTGVIGTLAHLMIAYALRFAPTATLAPLQYLEIAAATLLGYLVFEDLPDAPSFVGIAVIIASGLYVFVRERALERRPPPAS